MITVSRARRDVRRQRGVPRVREHALHRHSAELGTGSEIGNSADALRPATGWDGRAVSGAAEKTRLGRPDQIGARTVASRSRRARPFTRLPTTSPDGGCPSLTRLHGGRADVTNA